MSPAITGSSINIGKCTLLLISFLSLIIVSIITMNSFPDWKTVFSLCTNLVGSFPCMVSVCQYDTPLLVILVISLPCKSSHLFCGQQCMVLSTLVAISSTPQFFSLDHVTIRPVLDRVFFPQLLGHKCFFWYSLLSFTFSLHSCIIQYLL